MVLLSHNPDPKFRAIPLFRYFWHATSRRYFQARISPRYCYTNPDPEPQIREIQDPEKPIVDHSSLCGNGLKGEKTRKRARKVEIERFFSFFLPRALSLLLPSRSSIRPSSPLPPSRLLPQFPFSSPLRQLLHRVKEQRNRNLLSELNPPQKCRSSAPVTYDTTLILFLNFAAREEKAGSGRRKDAN